jgi:glycosyltransferase involved in cell wall biosynthesis
LRLVIATDAWSPQTNGVVTTLKATVDTLTRLGHQVRVISPQGMLSIPAPSYPEIRLALWPIPHIRREMRAFQPQAIHIATEGPLGLAMWRYCRHRRVPFTTSYHTRYPEYLRARWPIPVDVSYAWLRRFHGAATRTFVSAGSLERQLTERGFKHLHLWRRGVDLARFRPGAPHPAVADLPRPIMAYAGRVAVEKNIEAFLNLQVPGTKLVIGDGPQRPELAARYPEAKFVGFRHGDELANMVGSADVLVFPSLTDTFGLAMIEALACGVPVAAFPVPGPIDVIEQGVTGVLHEDLTVAVPSALKLDRSVCAQRATAFTWDAATEQFLAGLEPIPQALRATLAVRRSSVIIARMFARRAANGTGDAN